VLHQIGAGTLGPVFRAYDASRERLVAVKLFRLDLSPERAHRVVGEFERLLEANLSHPAIAAPIATGIVGACPYLAQDYVAAEALDLAVREYGPAPPVDALSVAAQLAGALDFAAVASVSHGMLHPRDVLLAADETRLTGLGVAHALERCGVAMPVRRPYTPPERMAGGSWDRRGDIFSLAALLHELLWGRRIAGPGAHAADGITDIAGARLAALQATFGRALAENPADRFDTALDFVDALKEAFPDVSRAEAPATAKRSAPAAGAKAHPLDQPAPPVTVAPLVDPAAAVVAVPAEVDIRTPARERFEEVEIPARPIEALSPNLPSAASSSVWPLMAALALGLAVGFAGGYGVGSRDHVAAQPTAAAAERREATDVTIGEPVRPASQESARPTDRIASTPSGERSAARPGEPSRAPASRADASPSRPVASNGSSGDTRPGRLLVRSTPDGALVAVDGREVGRTPVVVRNLAPGAHRVHVVRDGYLTEDRRFAISQARPAQSLTLQLERPRTPPLKDVAALAGGASTRGFSGSLAVDSRPGGAKVYLDGRLVGVTPFSLPSLQAGEHAIRLERDGYQRWSSSIRVVAAEQNRVTASLEK
jgi:serine/threonine protein kinase, bacterial